MAEEKVLEGYEQYRVQCQDVRIYESHVEIKLPSGMTKTISIADFLTTLSKTINQEDTLRTTLLPANCYIWGQSITEMRLACYYPGKLREVVGIPRDDGRPVNFTIPFPNIIVSHQLKRHIEGWEHQHSRYFATVKSIGQLENKFLWEKNESEGIWVLPLPNIYPEGRLCQGHNTLLKGPFRDNFRGLDWHFAVLHNSPFNDDLQVPSLAKAMRVKVYFTELSKHQTFPYELLVNGKKATGAGRSVAQDIMGEEQAQFRPTLATLDQIQLAATTETVATTGGTAGAQWTGGAWAPVTQPQHFPGGGGGAGGVGVAGPEGGGGGGRGGIQAQMEVLADIMNRTAAVPNDLGLPQELVTHMNTILPTYADPYTNENENP
jgi:hypothetical protein